MPGEACAQIKEELVACVIRSDCVLKSNRSISDCVKNRQELPARCQHLITSFTDCKRGMLDMRRRFRGNHLSNQEKLGETASAGPVGNVDISPDDRR